MSATAAPAHSAFRVRELGRDESLKRFIDVAWHCNAHDPNWVPPLRMTISGVLDRRKHPFHRHAQVAYFLAERGGRAIGRIAAIVNHRHNEFHDERIGFFGFFESVDEPDVAEALVDAAAAWLRERGMQRMRGPLNFSTNEEGASPGVLVEGFDTRPAVMMGHNPPYYERLLREAGLAKEKDLLAYWLDDPNPPERLERVVERVAEREGVVIRSLDMKRFAQEVETIKRVYNSAWSRNWGFVPVTDAEFDYLAKDMKQIVDPNLCFIAEVDGEAVGFSIALPDLNQALRHLKDGRLFPFGLFRFLWWKRKIDGLRVLTLGFKPEYQHSGLGAVFYLRTIRVGVQRGYRSAEASWVLEDNLDMRGPIEKMGGRVYRRYRLFEKAL
jgi:GNAT superfamily N-acetyltransferase